MTIVAPLVGVWVEPGRVYRKKQESKSAGPRPENHGALLNTWRMVITMSYPWETDGDEIDAPLDSQADGEGPESEAEMDATALDPHIAEWQRGPDALEPEIETP